MFLISEQISDNVNLITETNKDGKKEQYIEGVFLQAGIKNRNGRIYPIETMKKEVNRYIKEFVNKKRAYGELGHPEGPTINLERVSHLITDLREDGKNFIGKAKILSTPMGNIVKGLLNDGAKLGVSSRGMGSVEQRGNAQYVQDDFMLATAADIVADPSAPDAFVEGIMEGVEWVQEGGIFKAKEIESWKSQIQQTKQRHLEEKKLEIMKNFFSKL
tara:strand:- start:47569 stop:48219 length:651 start_codon:yes stop_codon:yes gene_type:complete